MCYSSLFCWKGLCPGVDVDATLTYTAHLNIAAVTKHTPSCGTPTNGGPQQWAPSHPVNLLRNIKAPVLLARHRNLLDANPIEHLWKAMEKSQPMEGSTQQLAECKGSTAKVRVADSTGHHQKSHIHYPTGHNCLRGPTQRVGRWL